MILIVFDSESINWVCIHNMAWVASEWLWSHHLDTAVHVDDKMTQPIEIICHAHSIL
jgi:hypothetical protein